MLTLRPVDIDFEGFPNKKSGFSKKKLLLQLKTIQTLSHSNHQTHSTPYHQVSKDLITGSQNFFMV